MSLTSTEELRLKAIESKLNTFQQAIRNLASKEELKQLLLVKETVEVILRQIVDETVSMPDLTDTNLINLTLNDILQWNGTDWINVPPTEESALNLGELLDVTLTNVIDQSFIAYDSATQEWIDVSLMRLDPTTGTITMLPVDPGVVKVEAGYLDRSELDDNTLITKAYVDARFALLIPPAPDTFPGSHTLTIITPSEGNSPKLCSPKDSISANDRTNGGTITASPGDSVHRIADGHTVDTNIITTVGPGDSGVLTAFGNGVDIGNVTLTSADESGTYTNLVVANNNDYPLDAPGFYKVFDCSIDSWTFLPQGPGWSRLQITHSTAGSTNSAYYIEDTLTENPLMTNLNTATVTEDTAGTIKTITGVPQYNTGAIVQFSGVDVQYITHETYYGGTDPLTVQTTAKATTLASNKKSYTGIGVAAIPERNIQNLTLSNILGTIDDNSGYGEHFVELKFINVHGTSTESITSKTLLLASGSPSSSANIDEAVGIPVIELDPDPNGNHAVRIADVAGDTPVLNHATLYDHAVFPPSNAAINAGGILGWNIVDYSQIYLPVGPDLSSIGRDNSQYATYRFQRRPISKFDIEFTGTIAGLWVSLPGVSTSNENDWLDMSQSYLGVGNPGPNGSNGCALAGAAQLNTAGNQRLTCTFGGLSSNSVTDNYILVRFKFTAGHSLTQLVFREASN